MLSTPTLPTLPTTTPPHSRTPAWEVLAVAVVAAIAHLPLLARHAVWLWQRPHYQFFPIVLLGVVVLAYSRIRNVSTWQPGSVAVAAVGLIASWLLLAVADFLTSAWLGCLATIGLLTTLLYAAGGRKVCREALPAWVLLWLVVPPPLDLDRLLMFKLQDLTTAWSSAMLDVLGVFHVRVGNVIEVDGRKLMVEQACSGINSLYSLLACTLFLVFLTRRGWLRGCLLLAAAVAWVLVANVARVTGVVFIETRLGVDLSTGWRHEAFGILLFSVAVALLLSTDQLFTFVSRSPGRSREESLPQPEPNAMVAAKSAERMLPLALVGVPAYLVLAIAAWSSEKSSLDAGLATGNLPAPDKQVLPMKLNGWEQTDFATQTREANSFFGEHSRIWIYSDGRRAAIAAVDYPFPGWHDLTWCYVGNGWQIDSQAVRTDCGVPGGLLVVKLTQSTYRHGSLFFCEFDQHGQALAARPGGSEASLFRHQTTLLRARARLGLDVEPLIDPAPPVYQFQVFVEGFDQLKPEEEASVLKLFVGAEAIIRKTFVTRP